jgi:hypothetical protein
MKNALTLLAALILFPCFSRGAPDERWRTATGSLGEIKGVCVVVQYDAPTDERYGLSKEDLQSALELRLKANDIRVLSDEEWSKTSRRPYLCLTVQGSKLTAGAGDPNYLFAWGLDLIQRVKILDPAKTESKAITWTEEYSAVLPEHQLRTISEKVSDLALEFANAVKTAEKGEYR